MDNIIIGTTPTIKYRFSEIEVARITSAYLTIKKDDTVIITYSIDDADVGEQSLAWTLTQSDTLMIGPGIVKVMLNWKLIDGTRGASYETEIKLRGNHITEVI